MSQAPPKTLHVTFSQSVAPYLREALNLAGRTDDVVFCADNFSRGPLNPGDASNRNQWVIDTLDVDPEDIDSDEAFWRKALNPERRLVAWTSTRVALERAGFLEWLWRLGDTPCEVIDLSTTQANGYPAILGLLEAQEILSLGLLDTAAPLSTTDRTRHHQTWRRLREENAPLRIIQDGELASAPLEVFDEKLLSYVPTEWKRAAWVVGEVMAEVFDDYLFQVGDVVLAARLWGLAQAGVIEMRAPQHTGKRPPLQGQEVRRPSP
jgi:hypothetical protein